MSGFTRVVVSGSAGRTEPFLRHPHLAPYLLALGALALAVAIGAGLARSGDPISAGPSVPGFPSASGVGRTSTLPQAPIASPASTGANRRALSAYGKLAPSFVPNEGQTDKRVRFYAQGGGHAFYFTPKKAVLSFANERRGVALHLTPLGANPSPRLEASHRGTGTVNYLVGAEHHANIPTYRTLTYHELWPGVDLVFRGRGGVLKYELHLKPSADPAKVALAYGGADGLSLGPGGNLLVKTPLGTLRDSHPRSYQRIAGKRVSVGSRYVLKRGGSAYGFSLGAHDPGRPLVIDPGLVYSTFLGGTDVDAATDITVDASGSAYVVGRTRSSDFPTTAGTFDRSCDDGLACGIDVFITKLTPSGANLAYSTFLGGTNQDESGEGIAVDTFGNAYVTGWSYAFDFPGRTDACGGQHMFVTKLNASGSALIYSNVAPGAGCGAAVGFGIAVDGNGSSYVTGYRDFSDCGLGAFVSKFSPDGSAAYDTPLQGSCAGEIGMSIAVDASGSAYVSGDTSDPNFPTTPGAFDRSCDDGIACSSDVFVTRLNAAGSLAYSTFLGGSAGDSGGGSGERFTGIAVDSTGSAYVSGQTSSSDFPKTTGAFDESKNGGGQDAFVTKLNPTGSALAYSTFLDGPSGGGATEGFRIAVDAAGSAYVTGRTTAPDFPTTPGAFDTTFGGASNSDAFVTKLNPAGSALAYSTFLGGGSTDLGRGIAVDVGENAYVTGETISSDFPFTAGAFDRTWNGGDAFVTKLPPVCRGKPVTNPGSLTGTPGDDVIVGTAGNDVIDGQGGNDTICGRGGSDTLRGGDGADALYGQTGNDTLAGGAGNDTLDGGAGADDMFGGTDTDTASYAGRPVAVTVDIDGVADDGNSHDQSGSVRDNIRANVENLLGGRGGDTLVGSAATNVLTGGVGADSFSALAGNDTINARNDDLDSSFQCGENAGDTDTVFADATPNDPVTASPTNCEVVNKA